MNNLQKLELKRMFKELEFYQSDYLYKNELVTQAEGEFITVVNEFLENQPDVKSVFDEIINKRVDESVKKKIEIANTESIEDEDIEYNEVKPKIKKLYREIVKSTHPDKIENDRLNDIYIRSTKYYDAGDFLSIYSICDELGIDYVIDEDESDLLKNKIIDYKSKIDFIQSTFTWKWYYTENENDKKQIVVDYVRRQLSLG